MDSLEDLFENAPCGYVSVGADGRIILANRTFADWTGHAREGLVGRRFPDLLNIAGKIYYETHFAPLLRMQGVFNEVALDLVCGDGTVLPVLVNAVERDRGAGIGRITRLTIFNASDRRRYEKELLDARRAAEQANTELQELNRSLEARINEVVQERLKAEEQLRQSQKMDAVGQLTGGVAHDFNNLLTIIRSSVDFLRRPDLSEQRRRRYIDAVSDTVDRAAKLTGQLLAFARRQALKPAVFDVRARLRGVGEMLDTVTGSRIRVVIEVPDRLCFVRADLSQFETALVNMAVNARDAMDGEGCLTLRLDASVPMPRIRGHAGSASRFAAVSVIDTGSGIAPDQLSRIFEPFFTTKEVGRGTGLGLSQVFGFAKQSGGDIDVRSEAGEGTTFTLYLPEVQAEAAEAEGAEPEPPAALGGAGRYVLVVEDNIEVGQFCTQILEDLGHRTAWAVNAEEALARLGADGAGFDVVFSDVVMPGMGGVALAETLRERLPGLPVVLASGYSHVLAREADHGFDLLYKPYSAEQVAQVLQKVTARSTAHRKGGGAS